MQEFGKYQLIDRIGAGGMAEVYLARSFGAEGLEKQVVIKRIRPEYAQQTRFVSMFIDEAKVAVSLNHPNVAQVYEFGRVGEDFYLAMEFVDGVDLAVLLDGASRTGAPFPIADAIYMGIEIAKALDYAHRKKDTFGQPLQIVHRDVSPQNILVSREGGVKLLDFGIAKAAVTSETVETEIKGKFSYMSPEQACGKPVDGRSDLFSLGIVLWEVLAARSLFPYKGGRKTLMMVRDVIVPDLREFRPDVGPNLLEIFSKLLTRQPEDRFESARELQIALTRSLFATGTIADSMTLASFVSQVEPGIKEAQATEATPQKNISQRTAAPMATQAPLRVQDTSERLLEEIVSDTGLNSHITEVPDTEGTLPPGQLSSFLDAETQRNNPNPSHQDKGGHTVRQSERKEVVLVCGDLRGFAALRGNTAYERWHQVLMDYIRIVEAIAYKNDALIDRLGEQGFTLALGLPLSTENDAGNAIAMSLALIEAVEAMNINLESPLQLSIGVIVGSAVVDHEVRGSGGQGQHKFEWSYDTGEAGRGGLYLAESLARAAMAREILVGGRILRRVHRFFNTETVQKVTVDTGEDDLELSAHRLVGPKSGREQVRELRHAYHKLFGRDLALKNLRNAYRAALLGARMRGLLISGEQGVGKSTLVNELLSGLKQGEKRSGEVTIIRGVAALADKDTAYGSLTSLLLEILRLPRGGDLRVARDALERARNTLLAHLPELDKRFVISALAFLMGVKMPGNVLDQLDPTERRAALYRSSGLFLRALARKRPLLLAMEDVHNIDSSTLGFLGHLMQEGLSAPVFLLMTSLPLPDGEKSPWRVLLDSPHMSVEALGELDPGGARELTEALLPEHLANDELLVDAIIARAGGNPLYIKELIELLTEQGMGDAREVTLQLEATDEEPAWIPTTVEGLVTSRMDRLPTEAKKTLQRCGMLGSTFGEALVKGVLAELDDAIEGDVMETLDILVERGFLRRLGEESAEDSGEQQQVMPRRRRQDTFQTDTFATLGVVRPHETRWSFPNGVIMEVAARGIIEPERSMLHELIADHLLDQGEDIFQLDVVNIAHHLDAAGQTEQAGEMYLMAAHKALNSVGGDECLRLVNKALDRIDPFDDHFRSALELKERSLALLGRPDERQEILEALLEQTEGHRRLQVQAKMLRLKYEQGELDKVEEMAALALQEARATQSGHTVGSILRLLHMVYRDTGRHDQALATIDESIASFKQVNDIEGLWATHLSKGITLRQGGRLNEALAVYKTSLKIIEGQHFVRQEQTTLTNMGLLYANLGQLDQAHENYQRALESARSLGHIRDEAAVLANLGHLYLLYGHHSQAHRELVNAVRLARRSRDKLALTDALLTLGTVHDARGRLREGEALVRKGLRLAREISNIYLTVHGLLALVRIKLKGETPQDLDDGMALAKEAVSCAQDGHLPWGISRGLSLVALAHHLRDEGEQAAQMSAQAVTYLEDNTIEGAELVLARHSLVFHERDPETSEDARRRVRQIIRYVSSQIEDPQSRQRYLRSQKELLRLPSAL